VTDTGERALLDPLDEADEGLVHAVDAAMAEAVCLAGPLFWCGPGRTDCCRGQFPVNLLDARRLQRGLAVLEGRFSSEHSDEPCPALDPATGRCDLYGWRPLACRTMGPPVRIGGIDLPPCPFCFDAAPRAAVGSPSVDAAKGH